MLSVTYVTEPDFMGMVPNSFIQNELLRDNLGITVIVMALPESINVAGRL